MTPVFLLTDGYIANGSEPWLIPDFDNAPKDHLLSPDAQERRERASCPTSATSDLVRPWAIPGTPGLEHRIGGLEKQDVTGNVSYDPANHEHMVHTRAEKDRRHPSRPARRSSVTGPEKGDVLLLSWGGTFGAVKAATLVLREEGRAGLALPPALSQSAARASWRAAEEFRQMLIPELNLGQLLMLIRAKYLVDAKGLNKVRGQPFTISEVANASARCSQVRKQPSPPQRKTPTTSAAVDSAIRACFSTPIRTDGVLNTRHDHMFCN